MSDSVFSHDILNRFLRYVSVDTMSDGSLAAVRHPTTDGQMELLKILWKELSEDFHIQDVELDDNGILIAKIPSNCKQQTPTLAFMAHVDTSSAVEGNGVSPLIIDAYEGGDISLGNSLTLREADNPDLSQYIGETLVVTDGTTLLGGDDKAGIAQIMAAVKYMTDNPSFQHGPIEIYFTSDEEIDCGMNFFPYEKSSCMWCYTVDGEKRYWIDTECFNAASVHLAIQGISYHLGSGRGKIVNAVTVASALISALPQSESPEATDGRYGYYCPLNMCGTLEKAEVDIYVRDFDLDALDRRIETIEKLSATYETLYPGVKIECSHVHQYYNFAEAAKEERESMQLVFDAGVALGMPLVETVIRGGTDGAWMSQARKIPCLNLFTGGYNRHSVYEWVAVSAMEDGARLILKMIELAAVS